jgi:hypothetical protein
MRRVMVIIGEKDHTLCRVPCDGKQIQAIKWRRGWEDPSPGVGYITWGLVVCETRVGNNKKHGVTLSHSLLFYVTEE